MHPAPLAFVLCAGLLGAATAAGASCQSRSPAHQVQLVELYTSEGCSSCPPADRWLSSLRGRPGLLAAAFHVDYWDRLGWVDRFASPRHTERQAEWVRGAGGRFAYTPQVLVDGREWRNWPTLPALEAPARVQIDLQRTAAQQVVVRVLPAASAPSRLALWWALLEDGHLSAVAAGENRGTQLRHDHVVRRYGREPAWAVARGQPTARVITLDAAAKGEGGRQARLLVVVTDAVTGAPLQAAQLACVAEG